MAFDLMQMLGFGSQEPTSTAEKVAVESLPGAATTGGLAGILAGSVLGGPVGLGVGLISGLASQRLRQNLIDRTAADIQSTTRYGNRIMEQLNNSVEYAQQFGSETDVAQLGDIAASVARLQELANHYDPQIRQQALGQLMAQDARVDAWREDIESRTEFEADRVFSARQERAKEIRQAFEYEQSQITELAVDSESMLQMLHDLGADDPVVQANARAYADFTLAEAEAGGASMGLSLGILNANWNSLDHKFTADEIRQLVAGRQKAVQAVRGQRMQELMQQAEADGFVVNQQQGSWSVDDANLAIQKFRSEVPAVEPVTPSEVRQARPTQSGRGASKVRPTEQQSIMEATGLADEMAKRDREFVEGRRNRRQRRVN